MYLSVNNHDTNTSILSIKEIIAIVAVFGFVLYLLFPKEDIDTIIKTKGENTHLSINYLESMLLYYPDNVKLQMILIRNYREAGEHRKALDLTNKLLVEVNERPLLNELYKTQYLLLKDRYFATGNPKLLEEIKKKLYNYFEFTKEPRDYMFFFPESAQIDFPKLQYITLKGLMRQHPELIDYKFEKELFYLASSLEEGEEQYNSLRRLLNYPEAEKSIKEYAISYLYAYGDHAQSEEIAYRLFLDAKEEEEIRDYFVMLLNLLSNPKDSHTQSIRKLIHNYQSRIQLKGADIQTIIQYLLGANQTQEASLFVRESFKAHSNEFNETLCNLAVKTLTYNQQLEEALRIAIFAKKRFGGSGWLDHAIQLSLWQGEMREVIRLNIEGYREYHHPKYEAYLLKSTTLDTAYAVLGEIYKNRLNQGDYGMVKKLASYFDYTGEIPQGERYFTQLLAQKQQAQIHQQAILFSYKNNHYTKGLNLYAQYKKRYGIEKSLQRRSIEKLTALKRHQEAYAYAKELKQSNSKLLDMAWIAKDYHYLYQTLWEQEGKDQLALYNYSKLIQLEQTMNQGKQLTQLYQHAWNKNQNPSYLYSLLYRLLEAKAYDKIEKILGEIKEKKLLEDALPYHLFIASYYAQIHQHKQSLHAFNNALRIEPLNPRTHQTYLWSLINQQEISPLKKEIRLLRHHPQLQHNVGFASVVGALQLHKGDLALRWLKPLLKATNNIEYQITYADILEQQGRQAGANQVRMKLFKNLNKIIDQEPKILEDKTFARLYLPLAFRYTNPIEKRAVYLKKFQKLFTPKEYQAIEIGYHTLNQSSAKVAYLNHKYQLNLPWLKLYLAMSQNNNEKKAQLLNKESEKLSLYNRVIALLDTGDRSGAYSLAFEGLEENQHQQELSRIYQRMIGNDYPNSRASLSYKHLSPKISLQEEDLAYRWQLYRNISLEFDIKNQNYTHNSDTQLALTLRKKDQNLAWEASVEQHLSQEHFMGLKLKGSYRFKNMEITLGANYHTKSTQSPKLQAQGREDTLYLQLTHQLSQRFNIGVSHSFSSYQLQVGTKIGQAQASQLNLRYLLRVGYPDIRFNGYLSHQSYDRYINGFLSRNFSEIGTELSIGEGGSHKLHQSWRPFGSLGLALNNHQELGSSLSLGISRSLQGADSLRLLVDYSKGLDMLSKASYGMRMEYRF